VLQSIRLQISLFHRAFQFTIYNGPTNALVCNKTLIQMSHTKTLKITPTCFDHQMIETGWSDFKCFSVAVGIQLLFFLIIYTKGVEEKFSMFLCLT
jgi:hypothetical protein